MTLLSNSTLAAVATRNVHTPAYDRSRTQTGVVHFGPGAFHRVHQAYYFDKALETDPRWGICEVALHSTGVRDALLPQDGLYTIAVLDTQSDFRVIGSVQDVLVAHESPQAVIRHLADPAVHLITATITEKGYCLRSDGGLDMTNADIAHDLQQPEQPRTFVGYLAEGLRQRRERKLPAPNILSCDNMIDNGKRLRRAVVEFAGQRDPELARWIDAEVTFPCTMVDSITPATNDALKARVTERLGVTDQWPVQREFFTQWVIEDVMRGPLPDWSALGVHVSNDIGGFERAKLRLLNGAHSTLAYIGSLAGLETVSQAINDPALHGFVRTLMQEDILPSLTAPRGLVLQQYIETLLQRFRNPEIRHLLAQIAWDGSQKLPFRLFGPITEALAAGRRIDRLCMPIAAWFHFVRRKAAQGERVNDPLAQELFDIGTACSGDATHDVAAFLALSKVFPSALTSDNRFQSGLRSAYQALNSVTRAAQLEETMRTYQ
jgi:fructuronate reductase